MHRLGIWLLAGLVGVGGAFAQGTGAQGSAKRPMRFADLMAMKRVSDPQVSPSGKWVLFSVTDVSLAANTKTNHLWVVPVDGSAPERQVTSSTGESFGRFAPNAQFVSYTSAPTKNDPVARITIATWDEATGTVGAGRTLQAVSGDADGAIWSPDSKHFLLTTQVYPECSDKAAWTEEDACDKAKDAAADNSPVKAQLWTSLLYRHWNAYTGLKRTHILVADFSLDGPNPRDLTPRSVVGDAETPTFSLGGPLGYAWAPDSREIAYVTNLDRVPAASTNNDVFTLRLDQPGAKAVKVSTSPGSDDGPQYSPDGKWLAFRSQARGGYESDRFRLMLLERKTSALTELLPRYDGWVDEYRWVSDSTGLFFASEQRGESHVQLAHLDGRFESFLALGTLSDLNAYPVGQALICTWNTVGRPSELILVSTASANNLQKLVRKANALGAAQLHSPRPLSAVESKQLTNLNGRLLTQLDLKTKLEFGFLSSDGTPVQGFLIKPPNFDPSKKYPVKFLIHGGPQGAWGDAWSYRWNPELMAASGYVVVMVNPRGSTGYGQAFIDGVNGDWGGKAYEDLMLGLDAAEKQFPFLDRTRECALGASYGGFMANWILTHTDRFKCIVTHDGMYNPVSAYGTTEELWFNEWEFRRHMPDGTLDPLPAQPWRYAGLPEDQDPFRKWSPMLHIDAAKTPTLVIHSQRDYRLDVSEGLQLFQALQRRGVPSEMLYFPDEGHWVQKPQNAELWNRTVSDWCDRWTHTNSYAEAAR